MLLALSGRLRSWVTSISADLICLVIIGLVFLIAMEVVDTARQEMVAGCGQAFIKGLFLTGLF